MADSSSGVAIAQVVVDGLTPLAVVGLGIFVARAGRRIQQLQWANQTVVARRLDVFKDVAPLINKLLCFGTFVGGWKEITPRDAIATKRKLDEAMYANRLLFSDEFFSAYAHFMATMFDMYANTDADAHIKAPIDSVWGDRRNMPYWQPGMENLFSDKAMTTPEAIQAAHDQLTQHFRTELYVTDQGRLLLS